MELEMSSSTLKIVGLFVAFITIIALSTFGLLKSSSSGGVTKDEVQEIVKEYIKSHPDEIITSLTEHQQKSQENQDAEAQKNIETRKSALENDSNSPVIGNPKGDVTIVEFFDYLCGYCKKVTPHLNQLVKEDPNLRVIFKEFPILSPVSQLAAQASLSVYKLTPEKYFDFHNALMNAHPTNKESILKVAGDLGLKTDEISKKMDSPEIAAMIDANRKLASEIGVRGTPAFTIGGKFIPGAIELDQFKALIKEAREKK
jgi:protein-disulfide isomerase